MGEKEHSQLKDIILEASHEEDFERKNLQKEKINQNVKSRNFSDKDWDEIHDYWNDWKDELTKDSHQKEESETSLESNFSNTEKTIQGATQTQTNVQSWPSVLAEKERKISRDGIIDYNPILNKTELLNQKTKEFISLLQNKFRHNVEVFNTHRRSPAHHIHVYKVSKKTDDFMLYRNSVKMVISGTQAGKIQIAFNQYLGHLFNHKTHPIYEILAQWSVFDHINWTHSGEKIHDDDLVQFFLSEFVTQSFKS